MFKYKGVRSACERSYIRRNSDNTDSLPYFSLKNRPSHPDRAADGKRKRQDTRRNRKIRRSHTSPPAFSGIYFFEISLNS